MQNMHLLTVFLEWDFGAMTLAQHEYIADPFFSFKYCCTLWNGVCLNDSGFVCHKMPDCHPGECSSWRFWEGDSDWLL